MEPAPPPPLLPQPEPEPEPAEPQGGTARAAEAGGATEADTEGATEADTEGETEAVLPGRAPLPFDSALPLTFSVNHFGLKGVRAGSGWKRGDVLTTWRARYFLLHEVRRRTSSPSQSFPHTKLRSPLWAAGRQLSGLLPQPGGVRAARGAAAGRREL